MKIALLLSGGVDSSLALHLLKQQGHSVTAFYLKIWLEDEMAYLGQCPWEEDLKWVRQVCAQTLVPLEVLSFQRPYWDEVVAYTVAQVRAGLTPNPDMLCNQRVKFGAFLRSIGSQFDKVATGHYAQVREERGVCYLLRSPDPIKDQTYFLSQLTQEQVARAIFPIGHLTKAQVRQLAAEYQLPNKERKDSQGICFLGKIKFHEFIRHHIGEKEGKLVELETGTVVGKHQGFWFYTIGQRQGLGLSGGPWYVVSKVPEENLVYISRSYYTPEKDRHVVHVTGCNWITEQPTARSLGVKLRHGPVISQAQVSYENFGNLTLQLPTNDQGIAPGQFAVLYDGEICLGGGVMQEPSVEQPQTTRKNFYA
jgi:tRNA-specific 2-thiouridylase